MALLLFSGCAEKMADTRKAGSDNEAATSFSAEKRIVTVPYSSLEETAGSPGIRPSVEVRMASSAELAEVPGDWKGKEVAAYSGLGLGALGLGFVSPPMFASAFVVYGAMMVTMAPTMGAYEGLQRSAVQDALKETDLVSLTRKAIVDSLDAGETADPEDYKLSLIILAYGFTGSICFMADAELILQKKGETVYRDFIYMEPFLRSMDAPPPQCGSLEDFSDHEGRLARNAIRDSGLILASIVRHRLPALRWKSY